MNYDPENMDRELQAAKKDTKDALDGYRDLIRGYSTEEYTPENHSYEWVTHVLMQIVADNPRCMLRSKRGGEYQLYADAMRAAIDQWCIEFELDHFLRTGPGLDVNFARGIAHVTLKENKAKLKPIVPDDDDPYDDPVIPDCVRVSPEDFVRDPVHDNPRDWMYCGHKVIWDKDELLKRAKEEDGWDMKVLQHAISSVRVGSDQEVSRMRDGINRDEIVVWELWCPKLKSPIPEGADEEKYNGSIVTLIDYSYHDMTGVSKFPRKPRAAYCGEDGPYALFDALKVPESGWPLPPLQASGGQAKELNAESRAITRGADSWKRVLITTDKKLAATLKNAPTDTVHVLEAGTLKDSVMVAEVGGLSAEQLTAYQFRRDRLDRTSGLTEASKGQASTGNTATADTYANIGAQIRMSLLKASVTRGTREILKRVLRFMFYENQIAVLVGSRIVPETDENGEIVMDPMTGQPQMRMQEIWHRGGPADERDGIDSYQFDIEPYSMERTSEGLMQRQAAFLVNEFPQAAVVMVQTPWVPWGDWAAAMSDLLNMPSIKKLVNQPVLAQAQQAFAQAQVQAQTTTGPSSAPASQTRVEPKAPPSPSPQGAAPKAPAVPAGGMKPAKVG